MKKEMLINVLQPEECRIAILEDGVLEELYVERASNESYVGNIYKGRIVNIEPSIQAAFVDFGVGRNGFLHVSDVEPTYWKHLEQRGANGHRSDRDRGGRDRVDRERPRLPTYLQGMDLEDLEERTIQVEQTLVNLPPPASPPVPAPTPASDFAAGVELDVPLAPTTDETSVELTPPVEKTESTSPITESTPSTAESITPAVEPITPAAESIPTEADSKQKNADPLKAHPDTIPEEEPKTRRRTRSGTTRRRGKAVAADEAATSEEAKPEEVGTEAAENKASSSDEPKPRWMESAEHRTEESSEEDSNRPPLEYDPDLFFPTLPAQPTPPLTSEASEKPISDVEPRSVETEPQFSSIEDPISTQTRVRPSKYSSIEEALEEDLAEAEIGPEEGGTFSENRSLESEVENGEFVADGASIRREPRLDRERIDRGYPDRGRGRTGMRGPRREHNGGAGGRPGAGRPRPLIQDIFKRGQEVIVQVIKEGIGSKGPTLSTYISIPGRYLVLMPCLNRTGVSRKIEDDEQRRRLRQMFNELKPPKGLGFIMRTAAIDKNKREVQRDLVYLARLWQVISRRIKKMKAPAELYQESEMVTRTIRDNFTSDIDTIWVDEPNAFQAAQEFMQIVMPRYADRIKFYDSKEPLFFKFGIEDEINRIQQKKIPLPHGGSIVIEQTEALVAIDVNSGNFRADNNAEETAYQMNLHAAKEIARQLRLRDLGGVIVNDFIDMREEKHRRNVEKALREAMKRDRARTKILRISQFGIIEMTRQRVRPSLKRSGYMDCPYCRGNAQVKTPESMAIEVMRLLQLASCRESIVRVEVGVSPEVADYLLNKKRREIVQLEETGQMVVNVRAIHTTAAEQITFTCMDRNDNEVRLTGPEPMPVTYRPRR